MTTNGNAALAKPPDASAVERALVQGDLSQLSDEQRISYYKAVCDSVGLNPLTKPFEYLLLGEGDKKKLVLYATRSCTDQLRKINGVSVAITDRKPGHGVYVVTAKATLPDGRSDESTGAVPLDKEGGEWKSASNGKRYFQGNGEFEPLRGDALANALMKAETKAKRRVTLSICGLGMLDESEVDSIPGANTQIEVRQTPPPAQLPPKSEGPDPAESAELRKQFEELLTAAKTREGAKTVMNGVAKFKDRLTPEDRRAMHSAGVKALDAFDAAFAATAAGTPEARAAAAAVAIKAVNAAESLDAALAFEAAPALPRHFMTVKDQAARDYLAALEAQKARFAKDEIDDLYEKLSYDTVKLSLAAQKVGVADIDAMTTNQAVKLVKYLRGEAQKAGLIGDPEPSEAELAAAGATEAG